jgi:hypothetical protein
MPDPLAVMCHFVKDPPKCRHEPPSLPSGQSDVAAVRYLPLGERKVPAGVLSLPMA